MKKNISNTTILYIIIFLIYLTLSMLISYRNEVDNSMYFGSDNSRAYTDLIEVKDPLLEHHRITVHPLMLILIQPVTSIFAGIFHDARLGLIILQALLGAGCVIATFRMLHIVCKNKLFSYILTIFYAFTFSNIIFISVPETFIFSGFVLAQFWLYIIAESHTLHPLSKTDYLILFLFGALCFGITITNYISFIIGTVYLLYKKNSSVNKIFFIDFFGIHICNFNIFLILSILQQKVWLNTPTFMEGICDALFAKSQFEEYDYMNFSIGLEKLKEFFVQFFMLPFMSADVAQVKVNDVYTPILFQQYSVSQKICLIVTVLLFLISLLHYLFKREKLATSELKTLVVVLFANAFLHYFYGYNEAFMYSPHYLFIIFVIEGILLNSLISPHTKAVFTTTLLLTCCFCIINNISLFIKVTKLIQVFYGNYYYYPPLIFKGFILGVFVSLFIVLHNTFRTRLENKLSFSRKQFLSYEIVLYILLVIISCISIRISYWRI